MDENTVWATMMAAGNAGLVGGAIAGSQLPLSRSRARLISIGGLMGGMGGTGLVLITQPDDDDTAMATILAGSIAGLLLGVALTDGDSREEAPTEDAQAAAAAFPAPGALLNRDRGEWSLSAPLPSPVQEPTTRGTGRIDLEGPAGHRAVLEQVGRPAAGHRNAARSVRSRLWIWPQPLQRFEGFR